MRGGVAGVGVQAAEPPTRELTCAWWGILRQEADRRDPATLIRYIGGVRHASASPRSFSGHVMTARGGGQGRWAPTLATGARRQP